MDLLIFEFSFAPFCQLLQAGHIIVGFLYVLLVGIVVAMGFLFDLVTWFSLKLYEGYVPWMLSAFNFLSAGLNGYQCG
jgi:hypothetical protein